MCVRIDGRLNNEKREVKITRNYTKYAEGSVLIEVGDTKVLCNASVEHTVPFFLRNTGSGWINAEYSMLPRATDRRKVRDAVKGKIDGRSQEIQRLIGRALRSVIDLKALGERTIWIDCDVIQADGGTRTAAITGAFVACADAIYSLYKQHLIKKMPIKSFVSATSVGIVKNEFLLDLKYEEDSNATVDMNIVMNNKNEFIEIQGTGEERPFTHKELLKLMELGEKGNRELLKQQREVLGEVADYILGKQYEKEVVIATGNMHKLEEIGEMLNDFDFKVLSLKDEKLDEIEIIENGKTFEHNSLIKARTICKECKKISIGDDSGIEVDALNKRPGIFSARYAGENASDEENRIKMFKELEGVPFEKRTARFVCVIAVVFPDGKEILSRGTIEGKIALEESGKNGFGYDCMFIPDGFDTTFGNIDPEIKNKISHRANALKIMKEKFEQIILEKIM